MSKTIFKHAVTQTYTAQSDAGGNLGLTRADDSGREYRLVQVTKASNIVMRLGEIIRQVNGSSYGVGSVSGSLQVGNILGAAQVSVNSGAANTNLFCWAQYSGLGTVKCNFSGTAAAGLRLTYAASEGAVTQATGTAGVPNGEFVGLLISSKAANAASTAELHMLFV